MYFHLWNLDAPCVSVLWQLLFARYLHVAVEAPAVLALAASVWVIYACDRLLDVLASGRAWVTRRHRYHRKNARGLAVALVFTLVALSISCTFLWRPVLQAGLEVIAFVCGYFFLVHVLPVHLRPRVPKELLVGILFAVGTCLAPWCRAARATELLLPALCFAALCCLNCIAIEVWEWRRGLSCETPHPVALWASRYLRTFLCLIACLSAVSASITGSRGMFAAILISAAAFLALDSTKHRFSVDTMRLLADVPLLSPIFFLLLR